MASAQLFLGRWLLDGEEPITKSRFSDEQVVVVLREADATTVAAAAKKHRVSEQTLCAWRKRFGGMAPLDVKRLRALETENARSELLLPERGRDLSVLEEINAESSLTR